MIIATYRTTLTIDPRPEHFGVHEYSGALLFKPLKRVPGYLHYYSRQTVTDWREWVYTQAREYSTAAASELRDGLFHALREGTPP